MRKHFVLATLAALVILGLMPTRSEAWVAFHAGFRGPGFYHVGPYVRPPFVGPVVPPVYRPIAPYGPPVYRPYGYPYPYGYRVGPYGPVVPPVVYRPGVYRIP